MYRRLFAGWREALPPRKKGTVAICRNGPEAFHRPGAPRSGGRRSQMVPVPLFRHQHNDLGGKEHAASFKSLTGVTGRLAAAVTLATLMVATSVRAAETKPDSSADENAIRAAVESYVNAYNRGDAEAVAAHWSESGEWTSPSGQRFQGRRAIEKELENLFAENKGVGSKSSTQHPHRVGRCSHRGRNGSCGSPAEPPATRLTWLFT